jgi:hypothetical protein
VPSTTQASSVHASESNAHATFAGAAVSSTTQDWTAHTSESTASHDSGSVHVSTTHAVVDTTGASVSREVTIHGAETTTHGGGTAGPHDSGATQAIAMHSTADELLAGGHASTAHVVSSGNAVSSQHQVQHAFDSDENAQKKLHEFEASKQSAGKMATAFTVHALLNVTDAAALAQLVEEIKTALGAHASLRVAIVKNGDKTSITVESENGDGLDDSTASDAASLLARYDAVSTIVATALVENDVSGGAAPTLRVCSATLVAMAILILFATF